MASNAFSQALTGASNMTTGDKGAAMLKSSGDLRVDAFLGLKRTSTVEYIIKTVDELVKQISYQPEDRRGEWVADIWRIWVHKRHPRSGEKEKMIGHRMFLALYDHFPETCIMLVKGRIFADMAYWKDILIMWGMINTMEMDMTSRYHKYNPLIEAFRSSIMTQRSADIQALDSFLSPLRIRDISKVQLIAIVHERSGTIPTISMVGKYCVRESSAENKRLHWYIMDMGGALIKQSHVSYMLRDSLKRRTHDNQYESWPVSESVPFGAKKSWRVLNAKLDEVLEVPEVKETLGRIDEIEPSKLPGEYTKRKIKFLLNEMVKKGPTPAEEETGNRRPMDMSRVNLRKRTRHMFTDPSKMNVTTLLPHEIAYKAHIAMSIAHIDFNNAAFDKKVEDVRIEFEKTREEMVAVAEDDSAVSRAMCSGNIIGVADVSGSMATEHGGKAPNRPIDIATGMVAFISCVAAEPYRDLAVSFTDQPSIFNFKVGGRSMTVKERMSEMYKHVGYNTNYEAMHDALIKLCVQNHVPEEQLPVLYIASDENFDRMDSSIAGVYSRYNVNGSQQRWETTHQRISNKWIRAGYRKVPLMVYHNINVQQSGVQAEQTFKGVMMLTGRSEKVLKLVLYGEGAEEVDKEVVIDGVTTMVKVNNITPYDTFRNAMEGEHFILLESILRESMEKTMRYYVGNDD